MNFHNEDEYILCSTAIKYYQYWRSRMFIFAQGKTKWHFPTYIQYLEVKFVKSSNLVGWLDHLSIPSFRYIML